MSLIPLDCPATWSVAVIMSKAAAPAVLKIKLTPIAPAEVRFVRLGSGGEFARTCIDQNILALGFSDYPRSIHRTKLVLAV